MRWPDRPVERIPSEQFRPPFCPHPDCSSNRPDGPRFRYAGHGSYLRSSDDRVVPRFRCRVCRHTCSQQTFATTYYMKKPRALLERVAAGLAACACHRQIARTERCAPSTVTRLAARLGRHALLLQARALAHVDDLAEPVVYDDLESFVLSQDLPCGIGTAVGQSSWFVYGLEHAPHRRGGPPRPPHKPRPRHAPPKPPAAAYRKAFGRMLDLLCAIKHDDGTPLRLVTDDHRGYRAGLARHPARDRVSHAVFANPRHRPSVAARRRDRAMFAVDLLHRLLRHSTANHKRETIAFGRRINALLERGFLLAAWRNWIKGRSERKPDPTTPAMRLGLAREPWTWSRLLARRLFPWRLELPRPWATVYRRGLVTPEIGPNRPHALVRAF